MDEKRRAKGRGRREPVTPVERHDTLRRRIISLLMEHQWTARELSGELSVPEREVYDHLEHIRRTMNKGDYHLLHSSAVCEHCGFDFRKRDRLKKPGRCPMCRAETISEPLFAVVPVRQRGERE